MSPWKVLTRNDIAVLKDPPYLVFTDTLTGKFSWISKIIKAHTRGKYSHCFWYRDNDESVSQDWIYRIVSMRKYYLQGKHRVKIWKIRPNCDASKWANDMINAYIKRRLNHPWWDWRAWSARLYDVRGIWGHLIGNTEIQSKDKSYCSKTVGIILREITNFRKENPTPADINQYCEKHSEEFQCMGVYDPNHVPSDKK